MQYGKEVLDNIKSNKAKDSTQIILEQTEGSFIGSAIGLFFGLYWAYSRNQNYFVSGIVGAVAGGFVSNYFINRKKKTDDK